VVYATAGRLFAVPFDATRLEVTGSPSPVVQNVYWNPTEGAAQMSFSTTGVFAYLRGGPEVATYPIVLVDRRGGTSRLIEDAGAYANPRLSPDGKRLALTVLKDGNFDIWVYDLERGVPTRLTFNDAADTVLGVNNIIADVEDQSLGSHSYAFLSNHGESRHIRIVPQNDSCPQEQRVVALRLCRFLLMRSPRNHGGLCGDFISQRVGKSESQLRLLGGSAFT